MSLEVLDRHSEALFEFLWCPVCGQEVFTHIPFEGVFCKNFDLLPLLKGWDSSGGDFGYAGPPEAIFPTSRWVLRSVRSSLGFVRLRNGAVVAGRHS